MMPEALDELRKRNPLVVLGIDPGTRVMGFGVIARRDGLHLEVDHGTFRTQRSQTAGERLFELAKGLRALMEHHQPDVVSLEEAFVQKNIQSALRLGEARAVVLLVATEAGIPVLQYPTAVAKKSVCGHGGASKELVQAMVKDHLKLQAEPTSHDAADALALALCLAFDPRLDPRLAAAYFRKDLR